MLFDEHSVLLFWGQAGKPGWQASILAGLSTKHSFHASAEILKGSVEIGKLCAAGSRNQVDTRDLAVAQPVGGLRRDLRGALTDQRGSGFAAPPAGGPSSSTDRIGRSAEVCTD